MWIFRHRLRQKKSIVGYSSEIGVEKIKDKLTVSDDTHIDVVGDPQNLCTLVLHMALWYEPERDMREDAEDSCSSTETLMGDYCNWQQDVLQGKPEP